MTRRNRSAVWAMSVSAVVLSGCAGLAGCTSNYAVDIRNDTPQPLYAQIWQTRDDGSSLRLAGARLGPGDRGGAGPVEGRVSRTYLMLDTLPNPGTPVRVDLAPGTSFFEVTQQGEGVAGPLVVRERVP